MQDIKKIYPITLLIKNNLKTQSNLFPAERKLENYKYLRNS